MIAIILLEPKYPGNIGSVARVMKNFCFENLILVNPCKITEDAFNMAVHAKPILKKAKTYKSFESAIKNFNLIIGTTAKSTSKDDYFLRITTTPEKLRKKLEKTKGKIAIVFGREDSGLTNKELKKCDFCVTIPTSSLYKSMNLSHAVSIILYELSKAKTEKKEIRLASKKEKDLIIDNYMKILEKINYPKPKEKRKVFNVLMRKLIGRALITGREANTLIGVLKRIKRKIKN